MNKLSNVQMLQDLKAYLDQIEARIISNLDDRIDKKILASEKRLTVKLEGKMDNLEQRLTERMDAGFEGVGDAIEVIHDELNSLDKRVTKLEKKAFA